MEIRPINTDLRLEDFQEDPSDDFLLADPLEDPVVTVDRKNAVRGIFIAACVLGFVVFASSATLFGKRALRNFDGFMLLFLGITIACVCFAAAVWIRARWICVAVLDESGVIASTLRAKYELVWGEIVGARSYSKLQKDDRVQAKVLLLLEGSHDLEAPIDPDQLHSLTRIMHSAKFKPDCDGQPLGWTKGLALIFLGSMAMMIGVWWAAHALNQFNNGVFFRGVNVRVILFKIAAATLVPIGGLSCAVWGLYHTIAGPILYQPGYLAQNK